MIDEVQQSCVFIVNSVEYIINLDYIENYG